MTPVYSPPVPSLGPTFWEDLNRVSDSFVWPWFIACDFNIVLSQKDKLEGKPVSSLSIVGFRGRVDSNDLVDLGFNGYAFT